MGELGEAVDVGSWLESSEEVVSLVDVADETVEVDELIEVIELCSREQADTGSPSRFLDPTKHGSSACLTSPRARL